MKQCDRHLDHRERTLIFWWRKEQLNLSEMARCLRRSHTSIRRELKRDGWCGKESFPRGAQLLAGYRREARAAGAAQIPTGSRVCAPEIIYWMNPGIDRRAA